MTDLITENARLRAALDGDKLIEWGFKPGPWFKDAITMANGELAKGTPLAYVEELVRKMAPPTPDAVQEAARVLLEACPNPLFDRLKPIIMGEVTESIEYTDDVGNERSYKRHVSWTAMKEIIVLALRAIAGDQPNG